MALRGGFVRATTTNTPFRARDNWGTTADPGHSDASMGDDQGFPALTRPPALTVPDSVVDSYDPTAVHASTRFVPWEQEPKGHEGTGAPPRSWNRYDQIASDSKRHQQNFGATLKNTASMVMRSISETFASPLVSSMPPAGDDTSASATGEARRVMRGFNSLAENNPGSPEQNLSGNYIRQGRELYRWTNRAMPRRTLTHTQRPIYLNVATPAAVSMAPEGSNYSINTSPFASVAALNVGAMRPVMRREPRPFSEAAITDGTETPASDFGIRWF